MITTDKVTEIFCIIDEFSKYLDEELRKNLFLPSKSLFGKRTRKRNGQLSESEVMTIMICYHLVILPTSSTTTSTSSKSTCRSAA